MVYIDVLIMENFIVNLFLITITAQTFSFKVRAIRICCAALLASFYTLCLFYKPLIFLTKIPFKILIPFLVTYIAFKKRDLFFIIKSTFVFIAYTFVLAGIIYYIDYVNNGIPVGGIIQLEATAKKHVLIIMVSYIFLTRIFTIIVDRIRLNSFTYSIEIITEKYSLKVMALLDTGNELREPITNLPVIIVEKDKLTALHYEEYAKIYVPYKVVNGAANTLEAFRPQFVKIYRGNKNYDSRNAIIAICENTLSEHNEYSALLSRGII